MRRTARATTIAATAALVVGVLAPAPATAQGTLASAGGADAVPGSYLVVFDDAAVSAQAVGDRATALAQRHGATVERTYTAALRGFAGAMSETAARRLAASPGVRLVSQNRVVTAQQQGPPPSWGLDRIDQRSQPLDNSFRPGSAWGVHVYVLDSGIRTTNTAFGGRATFDANTVDALNEDCHGHGTHVAGTIGADWYGVAPGASLHAVKVLGCDGRGTTASVVAGIDWVAAHRAAPAVVSLGVATPGVDAALDAAVAGGIARGVPHVVPAGNNWLGQTFDSCGWSPSRVAAAITVGATRRDDIPAAFSGSGPCVDVFAPGVGIVAPWKQFDLSTQSLDGTSMAVAHVVGTVALRLAADPLASPRVVRDVLMADATPNALSAPGAGSPNRLAYAGPTTAMPGPSLMRGHVLMRGASIQSADARYTLVMQTDHNLVQYDSVDNRAVWHTNTYGSGAIRAVMQADGNFVLYNTTGAPVWHTRTWGTPADRFTVQVDSNLVLYDAAGRYYWHRW